MILESTRVPLEKYLETVLEKGVSVMRSLANIHLHGNSNLFAIFKVSKSKENAASQCPTLHLRTTAMGLYAPPGEPIRMLAPPLPPGQPMSESGVCFEFDSYTQKSQIEYIADAFLLPDDLPVEYEVYQGEFCTDCCHASLSPEVEAIEPAEKVLVSKQWNFPSTRRPPLKLLGWDVRLRFNMERFWIEGFMWTFLDIFRKHNHIWMLAPRAKVPADFSLAPWKKFVFNAKVRFICKCGNMWSSMKGKAVFEFSKVPKRAAGEVKLCFFGQRCKACLVEEPVEAIWYYEEITAALQEVRRRVGITYYGEDPLPPFLTKPRRRKGQPRHEHDSSLCQACSLGVCCKSKRLNYHQQQLSTS